MSIVSSASRDWSRIAELVDEGLALVPAARAAWLDALARSEPAGKAAPPKAPSQPAADETEIGPPKPTDVRPADGMPPNAQAFEKSPISSGGEADSVAAKADGPIKHDV